MFRLLVYSFLIILSAKIEQCMKIDKQIRSMEEAVELNPSYIKKVSVTPEDDITQNQKLGNFV